MVNDAVSFTDATVADPGYDGKFPVMVYSHGDRGFAATSMRLVHHFVSHGWVVVAPDHITNTAFDNVLPRPVALYHWRTQDISRALDVLEDIDGADPLAAADVSEGPHDGAFVYGWPLAGATWDIEHIAEQCDLDGGDRMHPCG
ncbi:MAG: hypothetical protein R3E66_21240 [bacterium]